MNSEFLEFKFTHKLAHFEMQMNGSIPLTGLTAITGPSGCGKSTFLKVLAGIVKAKNANIKFKDKIWQDQSYFIKTYKRPLGFVFQSDNLFDHLSIKKNLEFAIKRSRIKIGLCEIERLLEVFEIHRLLKLYPKQISGGEAQRVSIVRSLLSSPDLLFLDEPLASLDESSKREVLIYLKRLRDEFKIPMFYITHSDYEIGALASRVVEMRQGKIESIREFHFKESINLSNYIESECISYNFDLNKSTFLIGENVVQFSGKYIVGERYLINIPIDGLEILPNISKRSLLVNSETILV
ncbi:MAG: ATP-binding cassette domain-containing protein [Halobacteriovoraceae bacterium]|nr:ATP-binding cassette domain-containing protein [Halobacteriovoraceae bacterium]